MAAEDGVVPVARPKKGAQPKHQSTTQSEPGEERETILHLKGTKVYFDFVAELQKRTGIPKTQMFRIGFREWCQKNGYGEPPGM